jgi:hypothetical protein
MAGCGKRRVASLSALKRPTNRNGDPKVAVHNQPAGAGLEPRGTYWPSMEGRSVWGTKGPLHTSETNRVVCGGILLVADLRESVNIYNGLEYISNNITLLAGYGIDNNLVVNQEH